MNYLEREFKIKNKDLFSDFFRKIGFTNKIRNIIVYLEIDFPILFSYEIDKTIHLVYVLSYDDFDLELNTISTVIPQYSIIKDMVNSVTSIYDLFDKEYEEHCEYFGYNRKKISLKNVTLADKCEVLDLFTDYHEQDYLVEDILPDEDFFLSKDLINKVSLNQIDIHLTSKIAHIKDTETNYYVSYDLEKHFIDYFSIFSKVKNKFDYSSYTFNYRKPFTKNNSCIKESQINGSIRYEIKYKNENDEFFIKPTQLQSK